MPAQQRLGSDGEAPPLVRGARRLRRPGAAGHPAASGVRLTCRRSTRTSCRSASSSTACARRRRAGEQQVEQGADDGVHEGEEHPASVPLHPPYRLRSCTPHPHTPATRAMDCGAPAVAARSGVQRSSPRRGTWGRATALRHALPQARDAVWPPRTTRSSHTVRRQVPGVRPGTARSPGARRLGAQEHRPGEPRSLRCGRDAAPPQGHPDRRGRDAVAQLEQLALDAQVAPPGVLPRQAHDQRLQLGASGGRPGPRRRPRASHRRWMSSRCQRRSVAG